MGSKFKKTGFKGITQVSDTSVQIYFRHPNKDYRVKIKCDPYDKEILADIAADLEVIKREIRHNEFDFKRWFPDTKTNIEHTPTKGTLLKDFLPYWLEKRKNGYADQKPLAASTYLDYFKKQKDVLVPAFGHICVDEITPTHIYDWADQYGNNVTTQTIRNIFSPLRVALDFAVFKQMIHENPVKNVKLFGKIQRSRKPKHDPFDRDEIHQILKHAHGQMQNLIRFAFFTGLRTSELCALQWSDYNPRMKRIHVNKAITQADTKASETKTYTSDRFVSLSQTAIYALSCQAKYTKKQGLEIFQNPHSLLPWNGDKNIRYSWRKILDQAGVRYRKPYQTRHTYASMHLTEGENPAWISKQMGHSSVAFTLLTYASYINPDHPDAGSRADAAFTDLNDEKILILHKKY